MYSPLRTVILVALILVATLFSAQTAQASALASPVALPLPFINADYSGRLSPMPHATRQERAHLHGTAKHTNTSPWRHDRGGATNSTSVDYGYPPRTSYIKSHAARQDPDLNSLLSHFQSSSSSAMTNSQDLQDLASQSATQEQDDPAFQQNAVTTLTAFQSNMQSSGDILSQLAADKGLANYDKSDQLEPILKALVNANKNALNAVYDMIENDPTLGPVLGPLVYEIKCIIDEVLDATENITDGILNALKPMLLGLLGDWNNTLCSSGLKLLGFCVL